MVKTKAQAKASRSRPRPQPQDQGQGPGHKPQGQGRSGPQPSRPRPRPRPTFCGLRPRLRPRPNRAGFNWWEAWGPVYLGETGRLNNFMIKTSRPRLASNKMHFCFNSINYCKKLSSLKRLLRTTSDTRRSKTANITKR